MSKFKVGDVVVRTESNYLLGVLEGQVATVVGVEGEWVTVEYEGEREDWLVCQTELVSNESAVIIHVIEYQGRKYKLMEE